MTLHRAGIVWDLDHTLYEFPEKQRLLWDQVIKDAVRHFGLPLTQEQAEVETVEACARHGTAMRHFALEYGIDEQSFTAYTVSKMSVDALDSCARTLTDLLAWNHLPMVILTSGPGSWAFPVLAQIGLDTVFPQNRVVTVEDTDYHLKSGSRIPFEKAAERLGLPVETLVMVEDNPNNLRIARDLGMATVLVTHGASPAREPHVDFHVNKAYDVFGLIDSGDIPMSHPKKEKIA